MENVFKTGVALAFAAGIAVTGAQAHAEFYAGASLGESTLEASDRFDAETTIDFEASDTAFKVFGGYMFNEYFGAEVSYIDLGSLDDDIRFRNVEIGELGELGDATVDLSADVNGFAGQFVAQYPLGAADLFAKVGMFMYDIEGDLTLSTSLGDRERASVSDDGNELFWGIGARYNFGPIAARIEYEAIEVEDLDESYLWTVGVEYAFAQ